jgi:long-chain acyl-CoA synthetase
MAVDLELYRKKIQVSDTPVVRLSVIDIAPENARHTLVFIHGYGGRSLQWMYQLQEFSIDYRVIAIDLRGHGQSDAPHSDYTMAEIIADLKSALALLNVPDQVVLLGHSFGGAVVTEFTHTYPAMVEKLVLLASSGEYRLDPVRRLGLKVPHFILKPAERITLRWLYAPFHVLQPWLRNNLSIWQGWDMFPELNLPTLVLRGHRDRIFATHAFEEVARKLPNAEEINLGASGHMVMLERRDATNRAISRFLDPENRNWRERSSSSKLSSRNRLIEERPWLEFYEDNVPYTVVIPEVRVQDFLAVASRRTGSNPAIIYEGQTISYRQFYKLAAQFANGLIDLGLNPSDRVMVVLPNMPQMLIAHFGILMAGGVPVYTQPQIQAEELAREILDAGATILITHNPAGQLAEAVFEQLGPAKSGVLRHVIFAAIEAYLPALKRMAVQLDSERRASLRLPIQLQDGMLDFESVLSNQPVRPPELDIDPQSLAVIIYTGGTTADPKGVMLSHRNLVANTLQTRHWMPNTKPGQERLLAVIPMSHSYGLTTAMHVPVSLGAAVILKLQFDVEDILNTIRKEKPTLFPGVPQMYVAISNFPKVRRYDVKSINVCLSGSEALAVETQESFEKLTKGYLVEGYGLTEASPVTHANPFTGLRKVGSIGIPLPSTEAKIVDLRKGQRDMPPGQIGELAIRGPQIMLGYWQQPQATSAAIDPNGWLMTGDVAQMDEDGYFRIIARKVDMWYPGHPEKPAFPRDIEEVIYEIPQIREVVIVAIAGKPIAFVISSKDRPKSADVIAYCKRRLPPELVPRLVIFMDEFPRTFIGKVLRRELARRYAEQHQDEVEVA